MSIVVRFPDNRICLFCKGADNVIFRKLKNSKLAQAKAREISLQSAERKTQEADVILQSRLLKRLKQENLDYRSVTV